MKLSGTPTGIPTAPTPVVAKRSLPILVDVQPDLGTSFEVATIDELLAGSENSIENNDSIYPFLGDDSSLGSPIFFDVGPSGVRALPLAAGINVVGHYKWHFFLFLSFSLSFRAHC